MLDEEEGKHQTQAGLDRLVALSDGVVAVAITLMALDIQIPESVPASNLPGALLGAGETFISYVISFLVIAVYWIEHHRMFKHIKRQDAVLMWLNLLFLLLIVLVPFTTDLIDRYDDQYLVVLLYAGLMAMIGLTMMAMWSYATHNRRLVDEGLSPRNIRLGVMAHLMPPVVFLLSMPVAFVSTDVATYMWVAIFPLMFLVRSRF